jgi:hypothetical protein
VNVDPLARMLDQQCDLTCQPRHRLPRPAEEPPDDARAVSLRIAGAIVHEHDPQARWHLVELDGRMTATRIRGA